MFTILFGIFFFLPTPYYISEDIVSYRVTMKFYFSLTLGAESEMDIPSTNVIPQNSQISPLPLHITLGENMPADIRLNLKNALREISFCKLVYHLQEMEKSVVMSSSQSSCKYTFLRSYCS